jgi:hypothetical protein
LPDQINHWFEECDTRRDPGCHANPQEASRRPAMSKIFEVPLYPYQRSADQDAQRRCDIRLWWSALGLSARPWRSTLRCRTSPVVVLDENDKVSWGSRAICFAKRPLEILDRLGCGDPMVDKGVKSGISARSF